ncbi:hypothetical protein M5K25_019051 [Dendrobium thyrsiflorum]|uniref:Protein FAR1-RELATED SEQUENCE n=1 Tax=Dendrobium thyrsiflorum TaxID=117978 RepID=A0ABD0UDT5_DENTH
MLYRVLVGIDSLHRVLLGIVIRYRVPLGIRCRYRLIPSRVHRVVRGVYRYEKEAYEMYCEYAHNAEFSVRKEHHSYWPNSRIIKSKDFVCSKVAQRVYEQCLSWDIEGHQLDNRMFLGVRETDDNLATCDHPQQWTVHVDAADNLVHCTCGKFSMMGILCSHIMRVFRQLDISKMPSQYLLLRWSARGRKDFYAGPTVTGMGNKPIQSNDGGSGMIFRNHLSRFAYQISTRAQANEDAEQYMLAAMVEMADNVDFILAGKPSNQADNQNTAGTVHNKVKDPVKCRPKGVSNARLKSHWEKKKPKRKRTSNQENTSKEDTGPAHQFVHATCSTIPECLTEEYILRRPSSLPSAEYTRMMMEIIDSDRQS